MDPALVDWLITGGVGPALVALPINWTAGQLASVARRWFGRLRHADGLSRLVDAAGVSTGLTADEFAAVRQVLEDSKTWNLIGTGSVEDLATKSTHVYDQAGSVTGMGLLRDMQLPEAA